MPEQELREEDLRPREEDMYPVVPVDTDGEKRAAIQAALGFDKEEPDPQLDALADQFREYTKGYMTGVNRVGIIDPDPDSDEPNQYFPGLSLDPNAPEPEPDADGNVPDPRRMNKYEGWCNMLVVKRKGLPLVVQDVNDYAPFAGNPVVDAGVRAYLGVGLFDPQMQLVGSLWVVDVKPRRDWGLIQVRRGEAISSEVTAYLEQRKALQQ